MAEKKVLHPLSQKVIDRIVALGREATDFPETEFCAIHSCTSDFKCDEPFENHTPPDMRENDSGEQTCFDLHVCSPEHHCSKPFGCSGDHLETESLDIK